jgi:archaellum component FlaC
MAAAMQASGAMVRERSKTNSGGLNGSAAASIASPEALLQAEPGKEGKQGHEAAEGSESHSNEKSSGANVTEKKQAAEGKSKSHETSGWGRRRKPEEGSGNPNEVNTHQTAFEDDLAESGSPQVRPTNFDNPDPSVFGDMNGQGHQMVQQENEIDSGHDLGSGSHMTDGEAHPQELGSGSHMMDGDVHPQDLEHAAEHDVDENQDEQDIPGQERGSDFPTVSDTAIRGRMLFAATAAHADGLREAKNHVEKQMNKVEKAISDTNKATNNYHESINRLTSNFGKLHTQAAGVHADLLNELKEREAKRMCAFANVERELKGEKPIPCSSASMPTDFSVRTHDEGVQSDETLASTGHSLGHGASMGDDGQSLGHGASMGDDGQSLGHGASMGDDGQSLGQGTPMDDEQESLGHGPAMDSPLSPETPSLGHGAAME